ncbi:hypothetical protein FQN57_000230 [Myotisia sp. PD_48]|nr:hypothetical protein FQN57_000230 [Myotisia sp. PD_48]
MFSSLFRPKRNQRQGNPFSSSNATTAVQSPNFFGSRRNWIHGGTDVHPEPETSEGEFPDEDNGDDRGIEDQTPLLPMFSNAHLDSLPVYQLTHDLHLLITSRCETTLTWEQLRSPQVSQFLLKPIQQIIHASHFSEATLYALIVNCLQFGKEANSNPGISGASRTRAMVCELLAIKLLKDHSTRRLIDALSYDFYPLQGQAPSSSNDTLKSPLRGGSQNLLKDVRISCLEIAIRAQAKKFLAHPLVVLQLEAIWAGTIVFYSEADSLHRHPALKTSRRQTQNYGTNNAQGATFRTTDNVMLPNKGIFRRSVALYNPRDASLFKLSRLRVPRYRHALSTLSYAILLGLFLTLLQQRPQHLTVLEVVFWFWSAGFMLDEIVGFNEQGFSLYLMSFWNTFDVGILLLLVAYFLLRLYGVMVSGAENFEIANLSFDVLSANAVLLLPRLFSVLDHYRYFSQLLIAFRMMVADLIAVLILILIACSGFFVAFSYSFGGSGSPSSIAYALFQMVMGFTPAAWQLWDTYNVVGKMILVIFLFITHFLVVTILITVLTNSFMAIVQNAHEEHQFLFAVNTISMVKSDALFSYVAPANILAWAIAPTRFVMPFRNFLKLNRTVIKLTHFPILFFIYFYERTVLRSAAIGPTDLVEARPNLLKSWVEQNRALDPFNPKNRFRMREPSIATHQKDEALDQVFRRPFGGSTYRTNIPTRPHRQASNTTVNNWINVLNEEGGTRISPEEEDRKLIDGLETRHPWRKTLRRRGMQPSNLQIFTETARSFASDPEEFMDIGPLSGRKVPKQATNPWRPAPLPLQTDAEVGDDELSSGENEADDSSKGHGSDSSPAKRTKSGLVIGDDLNRRYVDSLPRSSRPSTAKKPSRRNSPSRSKPVRHHSRNPSTATILYNPVGSDIGESTPDAEPQPSPKRAKGKVGTGSPGRRQLGNIQPTQARAASRLWQPSTSLQASPMHDQTGLWPLHHRRRHSSFAMGLGSDLGDNNAAGGGFVGGIPASFGTQMAYATGGFHAGVSDNRDMLSKLVLARMNTLEETFRDVLREVKDLRQTGDRRSKDRPMAPRRTGTRSKELSPQDAAKDKGTHKHIEKRQRTFPKIGDEDVAERSSLDFGPSSV